MDAILEITTASQQPYHGNALAISRHISYSIKREKTVKSLLISLQLRDKTQLLSLFIKITNLTKSQSYDGKF